MIILKWKNQVEKCTEFTKILCAEFASYAAEFSTFWRRILKSLHMVGMLACGWQVKLYDPLVTHGPYLSACDV